jgi:hypothetical protein
MAMALKAPLLLFIFYKKIIVVANVGWRCVCRRVRGRGLKVSSRCGESGDGDG